MSITVRHERDLQIESKAHILVQQWLDAGNLSGRSVNRPRRDLLGIGRLFRWLQKPRRPPRVKGG